MATVTFNSVYQQLWGTTSATYRFYGQLKCTVSRNVANNTYTISVDGIRAHGGQWNFKTNFTITLGDKSTTGTIPASGSDTYSGWMPKNNTYHAVSLSKTVNGNSDGTCPAIDLYFKCYNSSVTWLNAGKKISVSSVYAKNNIAATIQSESGGPNDRTKPAITLRKSDIKSSSSFVFAGSSTVDCTDWKYQLNSGSWSACSGWNARGGSATLTGLPQAEHKLKLYAKKASNNVAGYSSEVTFDTRNPTISSESIVASSTTSATVKFKTNYDCLYTIKDASGTTLGSGNSTANTLVSNNIKTSASDATYTINVARTYDSSLTASKSVKCYSALPKILTFDMTPVNHTTANVKIKCDTVFNWQIIRPDGVIYSSSGKDKWSGNCSANTDITASIPVPSIKYDGSYSYTLKVCRAVNNSLTASETTTCDTRLPEISKFTIKPIGSGVPNASIELKTNFECNWSLNTTTVVPPSGVVNTAYTGGITIDSEVCKSYTVTVNRVSCSQLSATQSSDLIDMTSTQLVITSMSVLANSCIFTVSAAEACKDWYCTVKYKDYSDGSILMCSDDRTTVTFTVNNIRINEEFTIEITAIKSGNGVKCSVISTPQKSMGVVYFNTSQTDSPEFQLCSVFINTAKSTASTPIWTPAVPYINTSTDADIVRWELGTVAE